VRANGGLEDGEWAGGEFMFFKDRDFVFAGGMSAVAKRSSGRIEEGCGVEGNGKDGGGDRVGGMYVRSLRGLFSNSLLSISVRSRVRSSDRWDESHTGLWRRPWRIKRHGAVPF